MIRIEGKREIFMGEGTQKNAVLDIDVSTAAELPALGDDIEGFFLAAGSIANIIQTGGWVKIDADGKWYKCDGSGELTRSMRTVSVAEPEETTGSGLKGFR